MLSETAHPDFDGQGPISAIAGNAVRVPRVPNKFQIPVELEPEFIKGCKDVVDAFQIAGGIAHSKMPDEILILALEASENGAICPGFLGSRRKDVEAKLNTLFGEDGWSTKHYIAGRLRSEAAGLTLYEQAYTTYLRANKPVAEWLTRNYLDVYDTAPSNIGSGFDYSRQEALEKGRHLHDIAVRAAVKKHLRLEFKGDKLLQIRGPKSEGHMLSPGKIPFHLPDLLKDASELKHSKKWWDKGSLEDYYQSTRRIVVEEFSEGCAEGELFSYQSRTKTYCTRLASRFFLRMLPILRSDKVDMGILNNLPWMIDSNSMPIDANGLPRQFTPEEINTTLNSLMVILKFFASKSSKPEQLLLDNFMLGYQFAEDFLTQAREYSSGNQISESMSKQYHYFSDLDSWLKALPLFYNHTYKEGKRPLHLARDAWVVMEYLSYRSDLSGMDREHPKRSVYIPGTSLRTTLKKNARGQCAELEDMISRLAIIAADAAEDSGQGKNINEIFSSKVKEWLAKEEASNPSGTSVWSQIFHQISLQFPEGFKNVVVVDTDGTGKSAQFIASLLEYFAQKSDPDTKVDVLLGGVKSTRESPSLGVRSLSALYNLPLDASQRYIPDARWPFSFCGYEPGPTFLVEKKPTAFILLLWKTLYMYNQAVKDCFQADF